MALPDDSTHSVSPAAVSAAAASAAGSPAAAASAAAAPAAAVSPAAGSPWDDALTRMEQDLRDALASIDPVPWHAPTGLGPIPPELLERATRILDAQQHTIRHLDDVRQTTARHLAAVRSVPPAEPAAHPVYFDLLG